MEHSLHLVEILAATLLYSACLSFRRRGIGSHAVQAILLVPVAVFACFHCSTANPYLSGHFGSSTYHVCCSPQLPAQVTDMMQKDAPVAFGPVVLPPVLQEVPGKILPASNKSPPARDVYDLQV